MHILILSSQTVEEMFFGSGKQRITKHASKDPITTKFGIMLIGPEIIAYGTCQVCHSALDMAIALTNHSLLGSI